jgi:D-serine ammonia-lyase
VNPSVLPRLQRVRETSRVRIVLLVDNVEHVTQLERFAAAVPTPNPWDVFIKLDVGSHRAGVMPSSRNFPELIKRVDESTATNLYGFYCHAGHSYSCHGLTATSEVLDTEVKAALEAAKVAKASRDRRELILSVGATPTAHVVGELKAAVPDGVILELHAGKSSLAYNSWMFHRRYQKKNAFSG